MENDIIKFDENKVKEDASNYYDELEKQIREIEDVQGKIIRYIANYKIEFGKHKGKTIAEIAYYDYQYYRWMKKNKVLPFTLNIHMDCIITDMIKNKNNLEALDRTDKMLEEQGYRGRFII